MNGEVRLSSDTSKSSFFSSVATVLGGQAACAALAVVTEICYARFLGPAGRGQISLCMMAIGLGVLVGSLGAGSPIVVWASNSDRKPSEWLPVVVVLGLIGCSIACSLWAEIYWRWHLKALSVLTPSLAVLVLSTIPVAVFSGYLMSTLAGKERFGVRAVSSFVDQFFGLAGFLCVLLLLGPKAESAVVGNLTGLVVGACASLYFLRNFFLIRWNFQWPDREIAAGVRMGLRGQPGNLATVLYYRFDVFLVSFFLGSEQIGLYALAVVISEALWQIPQAVAWALCPRTARTLEDGAAHFTCSIIRQTLVISCISAITLALASPIAVPLVFGERFRASVTAIWLLLPGTVALSLAKVVCADLTARSKTGYSTVFAFISFAVSVPLDLLLIPRMGIQGASITSSVAYMVDSGLLLAALAYELKVSWRTLLMPSESDFELYRQAPVRAAAWLRSALFPAARERTPS